MDCPCECIRIGSAAALLSGAAYEVYRAVAEAAHWRQRDIAEKMRPLLAGVFQQAEDIARLDPSRYDAMEKISGLIGEMAEGVQKGLPIALVEGISSRLLERCVEASEAITRC